MPFTRSANMARKLGRDLMRAYHSFADGGDGPIHITHEIQRGEHGGGGKIGHRKVGTRQPTAMFRQPADIEHMLLEIGVACTQGVAIRRTELKLLFQVLFP